MDVRNYIRPDEAAAYINKSPQEIAAVFSDSIFLKQKQAAESVRADGEEFAKILEHQSTDLEQQLSKTREKVSHDDSVREDESLLPAKVKLIASLVCLGLVFVSDYWMVVAFLQDSIKLFLDPLDPDIEGNIWPALFAALLISLYPIGYKNLSTIEFPQRWMSPVFMITGGIIYLVLLWTIYQGATALDVEDLSPGGLGNVQAEADFLGTTVDSPEIDFLDGPVTSSELDFMDAEPDTVRLETEAEVAAWWTLNIDAFWFVIASLIAFVGIYVFADLSARYLQQLNASLSASAELRRHLIALETDTREKLALAGRARSLSKQAESQISDLIKGQKSWAMRIAMYAISLADKKSREREKEDEIAERTEKERSRLDKSRTQKIEVLTGALKQAEDRTFEAKLRDLIAALDEEKP